MSRRPVRSDDGGTLRSVFRRPVRKHAGLLGVGPAGADKIRRPFRDDGRPRHHDDRRRLAFVDQRRNGQHVRRQTAAQNGDLVGNDQLLGYPLRIVGNAGVIPDDQLDLAAGNHIAVLRHVEACAGNGLFSDRTQHPGERHDEPDFDCILRCNIAGKQRTGESRRRK
jgi:hypothetical protein